VEAREFSQAVAIFADVAERARGIGDQWWEGQARLNLAWAHLESNDPVSALDVLTPLVSTGLRGCTYEDEALLYLSWAQRMVGNHAAALTAVDAALQLAENAGHRAREAYFLIPRV
jgi:hypothetical protein